GSTRGQCQTAGRDEETGFKVDQRNKTVRKGISVTPLQTVPAVVPLSSGRRSQKRTTDVLPKPDTPKSYRQLYHRQAVTERMQAGLMQPYPVPPTVMRSMRSVGWPTPT